MNKLNKLVTNYPVSLNEDEVANLSSTLLPVIEACGGGGGGGITQYYGDGTYTEITGSHVITLTNETKQKINRTIPTKVSDLTDSANYQTVEEMAGYETTQHASQTYLTKSSADTLYAPLSTTADVEALKAVSGDFSQYYTKNETYSKNEVYTKEDVYQKTETSSKSELTNAFLGVVTDSELETAIGNVNITIDNLQDTVDGKQDSLTFGKDGTGAISSINSTALAGQGGTTYSAGQYINIDSNDTISVTGVLALDEYAQYEPVLIGDANITATPSKVDNHTQWNLAINATPVVTNTKLTGQNCVTAHTTQVSGEWAVGLVQSAYEAIDSVGGIATDVGTLKTASAGWDKVSDKLDTTAFSTVSGTFLTTIPDTYATKEYANNASSNALNEAETWVENKHYLTEVPDTYALKADLNTASSTLTGVDNALSGHIDYISAHAITSLDNYYTKTQVDSTFASATQLNDYLTTAKYQTDSATFALKTETSSKTEITNALNTKVDKPTSQQTGKLVYDGDNNEWVTLPAGTTTIVQGQGSVTANYDSSNSTYTVSLLTSAENALLDVNNKIDSTAVAQTYQTISDMANYLTTSDAATTYQPKGNYAPESVTSTINTLTAASASWNEVSAKLGTAQYALDSASFVTSSNSTITGTNQYALTTAGWASVQGGSTFTGVTTASPITGDGLNNTLGLDSNYKTAIEQVSGKVDKPADMTSNTPYCFSAGQWADITQTYYSKTEATGTFLQKHLTNTLSGDGTSNNTLGVNWSNLSGNTIASAEKAGEAQGFRWSDNTYQDTSAALTDLWNAKNHVTLQTTNNILTVDNNDNTSATLSAMSYVVNPNNAYWKPQRSCVCTEAEISTMAGYANGQGMLFFVVSGHNQ